MVLAWAKISMRIPGIKSLKEKRKIIKSLKDRIFAKFKISISEVGDNDIWQRATLGLAIVSSDRSYAQKSLDMVFQLISQNTYLEIIHRDFQITKI